MDVGRLQRSAFPLPRLCFLLQSSPEPRRNGWPILPVSRLSGVSLRPCPSVLASFVRQRCSQFAERARSELVGRYWPVRCPGSQVRSRHDVVARCLLTSDRRPADLCECGRQMSWNALLIFENTSLLRHGRGTPLPARFSIWTRQSSDVADVMRSACRPIANRLDPSRCCNRVVRYHGLGHLLQMSCKVQEETVVAR